MISAFDVDKLQPLLCDFYRITRIRITVFDETMRELVSYPPEVAPYCKIIRGCAEGRTACRQCDHEACAAAADSRRTYLYRCHAGLTEAVSALYVGDVLAGYLFFGHVFSYPDHERGWEAIQSKCCRLPVNPDELKAAVYEAQPTDEEYVRSAAHILHAVASYLIMERMASLQGDELAVRLDTYLSEHYAEKTGVPQICRALGIGKTQLYKLSQELYHRGIAEHIRDLRITRAKELLLSPEKPSLAEIAELCGYNDYNYFIATFSRETGISPIAWRRQNT